MFSWKRFGVLCVSRRPDGTLWLFDGQHRHGAAMRRSDVTHLPCIVFRHAAVKDEARGFLDVNTTRATVGAYDKFRALVVARDPTALWVVELGARLGIEFVKSKTTSPCATRSVGWFLRRARPDDRTRLEEVAKTAAYLCSAEASPIVDVLLEGLWCISANCSSLTDKRLRHRIGVVGARALVQAAQSAAAYYAKGGLRVYGEGMLNAINKGQRKLFKMREEVNSGESSETDPNPHVAHPKEEP